MMINPLRRNSSDYRDLDSSRDSSSTMDTLPVQVNERRRIYVIEDDLDLAHVIDQVLQSIDPSIEIDWATSAEEASCQLKARSRTPRNILGNPLARFADRRKRPYDLIVADIFLEGETTGLDLWRLCQEAYPEVPLLVTSALPVDKFLSTVGRDVISPPFLPKPFTVAECRQAFEGLLSQRPNYRRFG